MRRQIAALALLLLPLAGFSGDVVLTTWNMKWFPSGRADLRISDAFERAKQKRAGRIISESFASVSGADCNDSVVFVQEIRDEETCSNLVERCTIPGLRVTAVSRFLDKGGYPVWQQCAILSNLKAVESGFMHWQTERHVDMPRGFTYAVLECDGGLILAFCVHLKSNMNVSGTELETQKNIYKREYAAAQILAKFHELEARYGKRLSRVAVAGDFNTNEDEETFVSEATLRSFYGAHFRSCFKGWRKSQRVTHPASGGFPDATFDYILYRGFGRGRDRKIGIGAPISDHNPVSIRLPVSDANARAEGD